MTDVLKCSKMLAKLENELKEKGVIIASRHPDIRIRNMWEPLPFTITGFRVKDVNENIMFNSIRGKGMEIRIKEFSNKGGSIFFEDCIYLKKMVQILENIIEPTKKPADVNNKNSVTNKDLDTIKLPFEKFLESYSNVTEYINYVGNPLKKLGKYDKLYVLKHSVPGMRLMRAFQKVEAESKDGDKKIFPLTYKLIMISLVETKGNAKIAKAVFCTSLSDYDNLEYLPFKKECYDAIEQIAKILDELYK